MHEHFDYHRRQHYSGDLFLTQHFYEVICGSAAPGCTVRDGYLAIAAAASAAASADKGVMMDVQDCP